MAGTRLLMQATFVVEFFVLAMTALYFGLYKAKDPLSFHLPMYHGGRELIRQSLQKLAHIDDETSIRVPVLQIVTTSAFAEELSSAIDTMNNNNKQKDISVELATATIGEDYCIQAANNDIDDEKYHNPRKNFDIVICPPQSYTQAETKAASSSDQTKGTMLIRNGIAFVYPHQVEDIEHVVDQLLFSTVPQISTTKRKPLKVSIMMEHRSDWSVWAQAVNHWLEEHSPSLDRWPCLRGPIQTEIVYSTVKSQTAAEDKKGTNSTMMQHLPAEQVKESILRRQQVADESWSVILYVPKTTPAIFMDEKEGVTSNGMSLPNAVVTTISEAERRIISKSTNENETGVPVQEEVETSVEELVNSAMAPVNEFLMEQCLGFSSSSSQASNGLHIHSVDDTVANWQLDAWLQQTLRTTYRSAQTMIRQEGEWLLQSSTWVVIDEPVAAHWEHLVHAVEEARQMAAEKKYLDALSVLEEAMDYVQVLAADPTLMEPIRFSPPQFLAIFAPLLLPLFLPHFIGLIREWKRYKKLRARILWQR